jgi:hypothetical protein
MSGAFSSFTLVVPIDPLFRSLAPSVATRYTELVGGSATDGQAVGAAVLGALERIAEHSAVGAHVDLAFRPEAGGVHVDLSCAGQRETIRVTIPAAKH